jgi:hypothetical protein
MTASFPTTSRSFVSKIDFSTTVAADHVNALQEEMTAVETHLVGTGGSMLVSSGWSTSSPDYTTGTGGSYPNWLSLRHRINNIEYGIYAVKTAAETAQTSANTAQTTANNAQTTANSALTAATSAASAPSALLLMGA